LNKGVISFFKENKRARLFLLLLIIGIGLMLISSLFGEEKEAPRAESLDEYRVRLESELADICSRVEGVGKCRVFVTFERGAQSSYKGSLLLESKPPRVLGVTVICRGADSDYVRGELVAMLTALFDIGTNRIAVLKLNS
jgi:hypothetical protein